MTDNRVRERRIRWGGLRHPERRSGFDRRRDDAVLGALRDNPKVLLGVLVAFNGLSMLDWIFTSHELTLGAMEANMVIASLITVSPVVAVVFKSGCTLAVSAAIWKTRRYRMVLATALTALGIYAVLIAYHLAGLASIAAL